ncbi:MAG: class II aldolase/adducin family protein [Holosporales bacterium]
MASLESDPVNHRLWDLDTQIRFDLAAAYRICAHLGLDDLTYTHLSARAGDGNSYYIYPFGLLYSEVTPDNLLHVSLMGEILKGQEYQYNSTGYVVHGSIYRNRPDVTSIFHLHTHATVAVSAMKHGLAPISQWALHFYDQVAYHPYNSLALDMEDEGQRVARSLGQKFVMLMRNHGMLACGKTIQEAMFYTYHLEQACKTQCLALAAGTELTLPDESTCHKAVADLLTFEENLGQRDWQAWIRVLQLENKLLS